MPSCREARLLMDRLNFYNQTTQYLTLDETSFTLSNSRLPDIVNAELVHVWGFPDDGVVEVIGNWFGKTTGYNDIIDITGLHSTHERCSGFADVAKFLNNIFTGGSDDGIDMDATQRAGRRQCLHAYPYRRSCPRKQIARRHHRRGNATSFRGLR